MTFDRAAWEAKRAAQLLDDEREISREMWRDGFFTCLKCVGCALAGMFLFGMAMYVTDYRLGMVYFWSALVLGYSGIASSLLGFYRRGVERGQW